jgi:hypothetical protein
MPPNTTSYPTIFAAEVSIFPGKKMENFPAQLDRT